MVDEQDLAREPNVLQVVALPEGCMKSPLEAGSHNQGGRLMPYPVPSVSVSRSGTFPQNVFGIFCKLRGKVGAKCFHVGDTWEEGPKFHPITSYFPLLV